MLLIGAGFLGSILSAYLPKLTAQSTTSAPVTQRLESFYQNNAEYEAAFSRAQPIPTHQVYAALTSHHFLAKALIAGTLQGVANNSLKTVIIVGPDHFGALNRENLLGITTTDEWSTPFGTLQPNRPVLDILQTLPGIQLNRRPFLTEHSIYTLVPFVKKQFPAVQVIPLILKQSDDYQSYAGLGKALAQHLNLDQILILISSDFSHEVPSSVAQLDDAKSITALKTLQLDQLKNVSADCKVCLAFTYGYLSGQHTSFQLFQNTNSFQISGQDEHRVTSYVSGFFLKNGSDELQTSATPAATTVKLLFGGDLMFDRSVRAKMQQFGYRYPLQKLESTFNQADFVIANLEGPVTLFPSKSMGSKLGSSENYVFTFQPEVLSALKQQHLSVLNLGNNHILNFGTAGARSTKTYLTEEQLLFFGDTTTEAGSHERIARVDKHGIKVAFVNYNQFVDQGFEHALEDIQWVKPQVDVVIVYPHWGNEYAPTANQVIQDQAHQFIDVGADVVIGAHPHVIQNVEQYKGKTIYYSLGNLVFDQYFRQETQLGLLVVVEIDQQKKLTFSELRVTLKPTGQTELALPQQ